MLTQLAGGCNGSSSPEWRFIMWKNSSHQIPRTWQFSRHPRPSVVRTPHGRILGWLVPQTRLEGFLHQRMSS